MVLALWSVLSLFLYVVLAKGPDFISVFLAFVENYPFPHSAVLALLSSHLTVCAGFVSGFSALSTASCQAGPLCFHHCGFVISFEISKYESPTWSFFFFIFQDCLGYSGSLRFYMNFTVDFSVSVKVWLGSERDRVDSSCFLWSENLNQLILRRCCQTPALGWLLFVSHCFHVKYFSPLKGGS